MSDRPLPWLLDYDAFQRLRFFVRDREMVIAIETPRNGEWIVAMEAAVTMRPDEPQREAIDRAGEKLEAMMFAKLAERKAGAC